MASGGITVLPPPRFDMFAQRQCAFGASPYATPYVTGSVGSDISEATSGFGPGSRSLLHTECRSSRQPNNVSPLWLQHLIAENMMRLPHCENRQTAIPPPPGLESRSSHTSEDERSMSSGEESSRKIEDIESVDESKLDQLFAALSARSGKTTLMIRNVPVLYKKELLLGEWPNGGTYDYLYLPYHCSTQRNLSYAFVNFTSEAAAIAFVEKWQKKRLAHYTSRKPLNISFAEVQGLDSNLWDLKKKRVKRVKVPQCQPVIFAKHGEQVDLTTALNDLTRKAATMEFLAAGGVLSL